MSPEALNSSDLPDLPALTSGPIWKKQTLASTCMGKQRLDCHCFFWILETQTLGRIWTAHNEQRTIFVTRKRPKVRQHPASRAEFGVEILDWRLRHGSRLKPCGLLVNWLAQPDELLLLCQPSFMAAKSPPGERLARRIANNVQRHYAN